MRKLLLALSFAAFIAQGTAFAADPTISGWDNKSKYAQQSGNGGTNQTVTLKWVRLANSGVNSSAVVSGDVLVYDIVSSDDGITVRRTTTSGDGAIAGIAVTGIPTSDVNSTSDIRSDIGKGNFGWIQVHGKGVANIAAGGANGAQAGDFFFTSGDSAKITTVTNRTSNVQVTNSGLRQVAGIGGIFLDAPAETDTSAEVFIKLE